MGAGRVGPGALSRLTSHTKKPGCMSEQKQVRDGLQEQQIGKGRGR